MLFLVLAPALAPTGAAAQTDYSVEFVGAPDGMQSKFEIISNLVKKDRNYPTTAALRRAAKREATEFDAALTAAGYYSGEASYEIERGEGDAAPVVRFLIEPGPKYRVTEYEILYEDDGEGRPNDINALRNPPQGSAAGADLQSAQLTFLDYLWNNGYPGAEIAARRAIANPQSGTASAVFVYRSGPRATFGEIRVSGAERTKSSYVRKLKTWEDGVEYERAELLAYRDRLSETGVFSSIDVSPGAPTDDGEAPIIVELEERKRRTIGAGASFDTSEGPGGRLFFENRNIFGRGESLRIDLEGNRFEQAITFTGQKPIPELPGFAFANFGFLNETTDAFDARSIRISGGLAKRWLDDRLETRAALALETSSVEENGDEERTYFFSLPLAANWDSENDLLNPTKGFRAGLSVTPYTGSDTFTQIELNGRSRVQFGAGDRFTLAGRAALGATLGDALFDVPINKRFFAGGGGSVRGFGFQEAGPLDEDGDPIGGRSLVEGAVEFRGKVTDTIQLAGFLDAGTVSSKAIPDLNQRYFVGYGAGVRYFTPIGPIRFDVAFPLNGRSSDSDFQILIALGQPF